MSQSYYPINKNIIKSAIFWESLDKRILKTTKCENDHIHWPPRTFCPICYTDNLEWVDLPLTGTLLGWTEVNAPPEGFSGPYFVGIVEIIPNKIKLFGRIKYVGKNQLQIGDKIEIDFEKDDGNTFFYFKSLK